MTGAYTIGAICAPAAVVIVELTALRTGILLRSRFWATIAITLAFQVAVDGWLTKLSAPIVLYRPTAISGVRWPWDIPVEDFGFAFAMITLTVALWERALRRERAAAAGGVPEFSRRGHGVRS
ncbi:MAG TPA: lycopene cyclase domain-containing protein [Streptosporangiaceae bacterium]|nr:lycopene cyclase domain-containing protein [Streptosporangiaceae bacterium]